MELEDKTGCHSQDTIPSPNTKPQKKLFSFQQGLSPPKCEHGKQKSANRNPTSMSCRTQVFSNRRGSDNYGTNWPFKNFV